MDYRRQQRTASSVVGSDPRDGRERRPEADPTQSVRGVLPITPPAFEPHDRRLEPWALIRRDGRLSEAPADVPDNVRDGVPGAGGDRDAKPARGRLRPRRVGQLEPDIKRSGHGRSYEFARRISVQALQISVDNVAEASGAPHEGFAWILGMATRRMRRSRLYDSGVRPSLGAKIASAL